MKIIKKLEVAVGVGRNPDMAYDSINAPIIKTKKVKVSSMKEAVDVCLKFIDEHNVGGGSWYAADAGWIYENGKKIARVAYNGNLFDLKDEPWKEPTVSFTRQVHAKYQVLAGFFSWLCPYCEQSILSTYDRSAHKDWMDATMINKDDDTQEGYHNGYGEVDGFDAFLFAELPYSDYSKIKDEEEKNQKNDDWDGVSLDGWLGMNGDKLRSKAIRSDRPIKIYHTICYKKAGSPKYAQAKASKRCPNQGIPTDKMKEITRKPLTDFLRSKK